MNSKILEVLNLIDEKSFKKCEKVIAAGLKAKKNEKLYLLLKCLLHSHVNEIDKCKQILETLEVDDSDENAFYILRTIYTNLNEGEKLIHLYEEKLKKAESGNKSLSITNGSSGNVGSAIVSRSNHINASSNSVSTYISSNNMRVAQKEKVDVERILRNLFDYCLNTSFFKKGSNLSLKLYKQTNDSKYLLYNSYLLYMNNSNNNTQIYNLALNFLKNYKCYGNNKVTENFSFFLVFFFINIKLRNYEECIKIVEYAKSNNFFLNPLQYQVYKLYVQFIFNKLDNCIDVLAELIKELPENTDYYILYIDLIIYQLHKHNPDMEVENVFNLYKNDLMYLEFFQKCFIHMCVQKVKAFPENIHTFWNCIVEDGSDGSDGSGGSHSYYKDVMNLVLSMDQVNVSTVNEVGNGQNEMGGSGADGESGLNDFGSDNSDAGSSHHEGGNKRKGRRECHKPFESIMNKLESLIEDYKNDVLKIYKKHDVKVYLYMLLSFVLKESRNYNMFYSIKNHLSLLKDDMIAILIVFVKIILKKLYVAISTEMKALSMGNFPRNELKKEIQKNILLFYKQIYNFEKLLYVLYKKDVHESFNRIFSMFIQVTNNLDLKLRDDNFVVLLVEMALYLDKYNLCEPEQKSSFDEAVTHMHNLVNSRCDELNLGGCKNVDEFLGPIGSYECAVVEGQEGSNATNGGTPQGSNSEAYHIPNVQNGSTTIFEINEEGKNERDIHLTNRMYYIAALSVLKYSYNYRIRMTEKENEEKKVKPILNNDYINVLVLMIYLNNVIGNFTNLSNLIDKLNIKNIQLITYSPILFIHTYSYSYFSYAENLLKNILNYYNVQQGNLKNSVSKCFQNNSVFKVNEIVNAYFLNSSNIIFYFIKLLYIFKKQLEAARGGFHFSMFGSVKKDYAIHNEYCTKFPPMKEISNGRSRSEKPSGASKSANGDIAGAKGEAPNSSSTKGNPGDNGRSNTSMSNCPISNEFFNMLKRLNEDILQEEQDFKSNYSKLMLNKFNFLTIDNQTILIKYNVPSFRFTLYKSYDTFFYNHILYETLNPLEEFQFLKDIKILNTTEANSVNLLKDIKTVYPMILLSNFYNLKGSVYITSHENILGCKNMGDVLHYSDKNVSQECAQSSNEVPFDKIKEHASYSMNDHEIDFFINNNIYVSFDKDNYNYRNKFIFKSNKPKFQFNENSFSSPFNICLTELFNYPIQTLYLNAIILNTVMYLFHKSFNYLSVTDEVRKTKLISKAKCAFLYLTYIVSYYQLTEGLTNGDLLYMQKELDDFTVGTDMSHFKRENDPVKNGEGAVPNQVTSSVESPTRNDKKTTGKDYIPIDPLFRKKYGQDVFKKYEIMQAAYHNDMYSKNSALHYKSVLLNLNMYIRILAGDSNVKEFTDKLQFLDNIIYLNVSNELNIFKQILEKDNSYQIINMSCLFKQYNYLVHNVTIFTLIIQSLYNHGKKKVSSENNMLIKSYLMRKVALLCDVNKNLLSLSEVLDNYKPVKASEVLKKFELELAGEIAASCKQHVLNLYNLFNGKMLIIKSYV